MNFARKVYFHSKFQNVLHQMRQSWPQIGAPFNVPSYLVHPLEVPSIRFRTLVSNAYDVPSLCSVAFDAPSLCSVAFHSMVPSNWKMCTYPMLSNCSKNMHSRGPTEQHLCALEPHRGCLLKVKKVSWYPLIIEGQQSHKYAIASPVEQMNLLSKVSNESLPKYRSTIWKNVSYPHVLYYCS